MKRFTIYILFLISFVVNAQTQDSLRISAQDSAILYSIELREIEVSQDGVSLIDEERKKILILKRRIYKVYPYAKLTAEKLIKIKATMEKLKSNKEKKKYFKLVEKYLEEEFEPKLKKLSRKDGQILVKLIARQTGETTFDLIKDYKSGWTAFWSNNTAKLFDINLKTNYEPYSVTEDYQIETILQSAFSFRHLVEQPPAKYIDSEKLSDFWKKNKTKVYLEEDKQ